MKGGGDTDETLTAQHCEATSFEEAALAAKATVTAEAATILGQASFGSRPGDEVRDESLERAVRRAMLLGEREAALTRRRSRGVRPRRLPVPRQGARGGTEDEPSASER